MLPTPAIRRRRPLQARRTRTDLVRALDRYALWAFNPPAGRR